MSSKEYERLVDTLDYNLRTRVSILTFSFTTVLAILGLAMTTDVDVIGAYVYLVPYGLIIPFTARVVYYRLIHARTSAYLMVHAPLDMQFEIKGDAVPEKQTKFFVLLAVLNNYEMAILSGICAIIFYSKYLNGFDNLSKLELLVCSVPLLLTAFVIAITKYGYNYTRHRKRYQEKWEQDTLQDRVI